MFAARFNPASNAEFLSGGWDNTVMLWDLRRTYGVRYISDVNLCGEGLDIDKMGRQVSSSHILGYQVRLGYAN